MRIDTPPYVTPAGVETLSNKTLTSPVLQGTVDGWISANETWTYASASTITVPTGAASKYKKGDRIKWTQTTVKYGAIVTVADTLLTIQVNTDYVVTDAAISANFYSHELNPIGYPGWFAMAAPTWTVSTFDDGAGGQPTTNIFRISIKGNTAFVKCQGSGTKAGANWYIVHNGGNMPVPANVTAAIKNVFGSCNAAWASNDFNGCAAYHSVDGWYMIFNSDVNIADNQAITGVTWSAIYEF